MIEPHLIFLYDYTLRDTEQFVDVMLSVPDIFDVNSIKLTLKEDNRTIKITSNQKIPFVCGTLFSTIDSYSQTYENNVLSFRLVKKEKQLWPFLIVTNDQTSLEIDPKSAFSLYYIYEKSPQQDEDREIYLQYLKFSANVGYVPAIRSYGKLLVKSRETLSEGIKLLSIGMQKYYDAECQFLLALVYSQFPTMHNESLELMEKAADAGFPDAMAACGEFYSPLSNITYEKKDAKKAIEWFNKVLEIEQNWVALFELSKLYLYGVGYEKDINKAKELYEKAKSIHPTCPQLIELETEEKKEEKEPSQTKRSRSLITIGITTVVVVGFAAIVYRSIRKSKK